MKKHIERFNFPLSYETLDSISLEIAYKHDKESEKCSLMKEKNYTPLIVIYQKLEDLTETLRRLENLISTLGIPNDYAKDKIIQLPSGIQVMFKLKKI